MTLFYFIFVLGMIGYAVLIEFYHRAWNRINTEMLERDADISEHNNRRTIDAGRMEHLEDEYAQRITPGYRPPTAGNTTVSVIVALRNEAANVGALMNSLLSQEYPAALIEFILIDDHSEDETWNLLQTYSDRPGVQIHSLKDDGGIAYKKAAIAKGVALASGQLIVTTDADCSAGKHWISTIVQFYEQTASAFVAAPVVMAGNKGLLAIFQSLDFITLQGITGASVAKQFHCMCNGANLAYEKSAFNEVGGFEGIDSIPSGDDMLLMYKIFAKYPDRVQYLKDPAAIVSTASATTWRQFFHQRIRWASKAVHYEDKMVFRVLLLVYFVNVSFVVSAIAAFFSMNYLWFFILMLFAKVLIEFPFVNSIATFFGRQQLMKYFPFMQPLHIIYTVIAGWLGRFGSYQWKGRKIYTHGTVTKRT